MGRTNHYLTVNQSRYTYRYWYW